MSKEPKKPAAGDRSENGRSRPQERISEARARADAAASRVSRASRKRYGEISAKEPREWIGHLNDPDLTPEDRRRLRDRIAQLLPAQRRRGFSSWNGSLAVKRVMRLVWRWKTFGGAAAAVFAIVLTIAANTATIVIFMHPAAVIFTAPDGREFQHTYAVGDWGLAVRRLPWKRQLRHWFDGEGYAYADIPNDAVQ